ncbi:hypothetical protein [Methyloceanibacter stevinii]|nr:hypothetical protein [Methyloceanibacter stevinii]
MSGNYAEAKSQTKNRLNARYGIKIEAIEKRRLVELAGLRKLHREAEMEADKLRQQRERDRELGRELTEQRIREWKKTRRKEPRIGDKRLRPDFEKAAQPDPSKEERLGSAIARLRQRSRRQRSRDRDRGHER